MTLNLVLVAPSAIYVSTDYRLSDLRSRKRIHSRGHKVVTILGLPGLVSFTGIATTSRGEAVADWMARQFPQGPLYEIDEVVGRLLQADDWLRHWPRPDRRMSFTIATYDNGQPVVTLISNYQDITGRTFPEVRQRLSFTTARPRAPWCLATGRPDGLKGPDRRRLEHLSSAPALRVYELMAEANRTVSRRVGNDFVSPSCAVGSVEPSGRMAGRPFDDEPYPNIPPEWARIFAMTGVRLRSTKVGADGRPEPIRPVQWATSAVDKTQR